MAEQCFELMELDRMPRRSGVQMEVMGDSGGPRAVRFRAVKLRRLRRDRLSLWSGWFSYDGEPVRLVWAAFDWDTRTVSRQPE